ncbi:hypothetical protein JQ580_18605 [Bradyrhizobium japonicum]|nr:hypothetical protein [Bradyrhizobium japonicum]
MAFVSCLPITMEAVVAVVIAAAAMTVVTVGNAEDAFDSTNGAAHACTDDASDRATNGPGNPVALVRAFLGAPDDSLGVAGLRQRQQREQDGGGCERQADGQTGRRRRGGDTGFVHLRSQGLNGGARRLSRQVSINAPDGGIVAPS